MLEVLQICVFFKPLENLANMDREVNKIKTGKTSKILQGVEQVYCHTSFNLGYSIKEILDLETFCNKNYELWLF